MAPAMPSVAWTTTAGSAVGMICRSRTRGVVAPNACAARTYSNSRARRTCPLTRRAYPTQPMMVSANSTLPRLGPSTATSAMASRVREGQQNIGDAADHLVGNPAVVAGDRAEQRAHQCRDRYDDHRHEERDPRSSEYARQDVPAELVEAKRVSGGRCRQAQT